jgi:hypothetical protein
MGIDQAGVPYISVVVVKRPRRVLLLALLMYGFGSPRKYVVYLQAVAEDYTLVQL